MQNITISVKSQPMNMFNWGPKAWKPDETVLGNAGEEQGSVCTAQLPAEML